MLPVSSDNDNNRTIDCFNLYTTYLYADVTGYFVANDASTFANMGVMRRRIGKYSPTLIITKLYLVLQLLKKLLVRQILERIRIIFTDSSVTNPFHTHSRSLWHLCSIWASCHERQKAFSFKINDWCIFLITLIMFM